MIRRNRKLQSDSLLPLARFAPALWIAPALRTHRGRNRGLASGAAGHLLLIAAK